MKSNIIRRGIIYIIGVFILAMGISFSVKSSLGVSPVTSVPFVLSRITKITLGTATTIIYIIYIGAQYLMLRKDFPLHYLLQLPVSFLFGYFTDFTGMIIAPFPNSTYVLRGVCLIIGICFVALGVKFYLTANIVAVPGDGIMLAFAHVTKFPVPRSKNIIDCSSAALSIIVSLIVFRNINGIGVGTIVSALATGQVLKVMGWIFDKPLARFLATAENKK